MERVREYAAKPMNEHYAKIWFEKDEYRVAVLEAFMNIWKGVQEYPQERRNELLDKYRAKKNTILKNIETFDESIRPLAARECLIFSALVNLLVKGEKNVPFPEELKK